MPLTRSGPHLPRFGVGALVECNVPVANPAAGLLPQITWGDDYALIDSGCAPQFA